MFSPSGTQLSPLRNLESTGISSSPAPHKFISLETQTGTHSVRSSVVVQSWNTYCELCVPPWSKLRAHGLPSKTTTDVQIFRKSGFTQLCCFTVATFTGLSQLQARLPWKHCLSVQISQSGANYRNCWWATLTCLPETLSTLNND